MVDWKIYIDSPQQRALKACKGSLIDGDGRGRGSDFTSESRWGAGYGDGYSYRYGSSRDSVEAGSGRGSGYGCISGDGLADDFTGYGDDGYSSQVW